MGVGTAWWRIMQGLGVLGSRGILAKTRRFVFCQQSLLSAFGVGKLTWIYADSGQLTEIFHA